MKDITIQPKQTCHICTCGKSEKIPYCDGTHTKINEEKGTSYRPLKVSNPSDEETKIEVDSNNWQ